MTRRQLAYVYLAFFLGMAVTFYVWHRSCRSCQRRSRLVRNRLKMLFSDRLRD